jgi:phage tail sheath protein FI
MADFFHGVQTSQRETSVSTPVTAGSGIPFVVGTAPVHTVDGKVNAPILCNTYAEAVEALGYSDDWEKYSLCEMVYSHFKLFAMSPMVVVNVLDPTKHKASVDAAPVTFAEQQAKLPYEAIPGSVKITSADGSTEYVAGTDYDVFFEDDALIVEIIEGGSIPTDATSLNIAYNKVDTEAVTKKDIIGGFDVNTKQYSGFELIDQVFPKYLIIPDLLLAPGWTNDSEVAAIMATKAANINGLFEGKALIDADCDTVRYYTDVPEWRNSKNLYNKTEIILWPMLQLAERRFHFSVQAAGLMAQVDSDNDDCPCESPSNKSLQMDSMVLADGTEVTLDLTQANYLNSVGIVTALNFIGGFVMWGNYTACYPSNTDVKDYFIPVSRMFHWVGNSLILSYWSKTDRKMTRRLMDSIVDSVNIWLNGLTAEEKLLGGRVEVLDSENPLTDLMAGIIRFHLYITPPSPAQEIDFILEYDTSYVETALAA